MVLNFFRGYAPLLSLLVQLAKRKCIEQKNKNQPSLLNEYYFIGSGTYFVINTFIVEVGYDQT